MTLGIELYFGPHVLRYAVLDNMAAAGAVRAPAVAAGDWKRATLWSPPCKLVRCIEGAEATVDRAFALCCDMGFPIGVEMCLHQHNKHTLRESIRHLGELEVEHVKTDASLPYHPTALSKDFGSFCEMNAFECTFHDLRHTFATMMIAGGNARFAHYVRTVASYLGHSNVALTFNTYAEVGPDAKRAAVDKIGEAFDIDLDGVFAKEAGRPALGFSFTIEQLEFMLAEAKRRKEGGDDGFEAILVPAC